MLSLTATGLNLINTKVRRSYTFKAGKFKDFDFQKYGESFDPVCSLVYSQQYENGTFVVEKLNLSQKFYRMLRIDAQLQFYV